MADKTIKITLNNSWNAPAKELKAVPGYSYFEALEAVTADLADFQEEARQDGSYVKTVELLLKVSGTDKIKEFRYDSYVDLDKDVCDYFAEEVASDCVIDGGSLKVSFA